MGVVAISLYMTTVEAKDELHLHKQLLFGMKLVHLVDMPGEL